MLKSSPKDRFSRRRNRVFSRKRDAPFGFSLALGCMEFQQSESLEVQQRAYNNVYGVLSSFVLATVLFMGFIGMAIFLQALPPWDRGGKTITYIAAVVILALATLMRVRRCVITAHALQRHDPHRRWPSVSRTCCMLCAQTWSDASFAVRAYGHRISTF